MANATRKLGQFRISDENLNMNNQTAEAYEIYSQKRHVFCDARKELTEAIKALHDLLDGPLRSGGLVQKGAVWTLKDDDSDGLLIQVWSEPKRRGRRKPDIPTQQISLSGKNVKAA